MSLSIPAFGPIGAERAPGAVTVDVGGRLRSWLRARTDAAEAAAAARDGLLDAVVIASAMLFVLLVGGVGVLVLQAHFGWY